MSVILNYALKKVNLSIISDNSLKNNSACEFSEVANMKGMYIKPMVHQNFNEIGRIDFEKLCIS